MIEAAQALGRYTSHDWIGRVDVPTAVIVIRRDQLVRAECQRKLAVAVPGATMHELDGDHAVGVREPVRFVPVIVDACLDLTRRALAGV
jgi:pimeloyl-ACP methyl ester carboxylesterase